MQKHFVALKVDPEISALMNVLEIAQSQIEASDEDPLRPPYPYYLLHCTEVHQAEYGFLTLVLAVQSQPLDMGIHSITVPAQCLAWSIAQEAGAARLPLGFV